MKRIACALLMLSTAIQTSLAGNRPNIVVILTDDQGYADISFNPDHPQDVSTPNMDALAREGVFFSQAYTSGSVCSPTRAGLMLGRYQQRVGVYLAYNAAHAPAQAPEEDIERYQKQFPNLTRKRATLMAMLHHLDLGIGAVVDKLKQEGLRENTLLFFLTDNGGAKAMEANNGILRGYKGSLYEGGIRTPRIVSWPSKFKGGRVIQTPVISLDILPTVLDALDVPSPPDTPFDGKSLLPLLTGESDMHHSALYWNSGGPRAEWADPVAGRAAQGRKERSANHHLVGEPILGPAPSGRQAAQDRVHAASVFRVPKRVSLRSDSLEPAITVGRTADLPAFLISWT